MKKTEKKQLTRPKNGAILAKRLREQRLFFEQGKQNPEKAKNFS